MGSENGRNETITCALHVAISLLELREGQVLDVHWMLDRLEEVERGRTQGPRPDRRTAYRWLTSLEGLGLIDKVEIGYVVNVCCARAAARAFGRSAARNNQGE